MAEAQALAGGSGGRADSFLSEEVHARLVPYQIEGQYKPTFVSGDLRAKILGDVFGASAELPE